MKLLKAQTIGHKTLKRSGWFSLSPELTILYGPPGSGKRAVLQSLESINPFYDLEQARPFDDYSKFNQVGQRTRKIIPAKKTAVFGVFVCDQPLREQLAALDHVFFETDRIEVGRRMDYSRWTTFVEIAASTRWSEIAEPLQALYRKNCEVTGCPGDEAVLRLFEYLNPTDRLKDESAALLVQWLKRLKAEMGQSEQATIEQCLFAVRRAERFCRARDMVAEYLPLFFHLTPERTIDSVYERASIYDTGASRDPIVFLIHALLDRHQGQTAGELNAERSEHLLTLNTPPENDFPYGQFWPQFFLNDDRFEIVFTSNQGDEVPLGILPPLERKWALLRTIIALHRALFDKPPVLLLDRFETGLSAEEQKNILPGLQMMAASCQIVLASSDKRMARKTPEKNVRTILTGQDGPTII